MKIEFEINEAQEKVLNEILPIVSFNTKKDISANDLARTTFIQMLIKNKQILVEQELKGEPRGA